MSPYVEPIVSEMITATVTTVPRKTFVRGLTLELM